MEFAFNLLFPLSAFHCGIGSHYCFVLEGFRSGVANKTKTVWLTCEWREQWRQCAPPSPSLLPCAAPLRCGPPLLTSSRAWCSSLAAAQSGTWGTPE